MEIVKTILRGLNLCKNGPPPTETRNPSQHSSRQDKPGDADGEVEALLRVLASSLIAYALRKYATSGHNQKRRKAGGVDVDFVMLEKVGQTILDKLIQAGAKASKAHKNSKKSTEEAEEKKKNKCHGEERRGDRRRSRYDRPKRDPSHDEAEGHHHERRRRHRRKDYNEEHPKPHHRQQTEITVTPPTLPSQSPDDGRGRSRRRRTSIVRAEERPPEDKTHDDRAEVLDMDSLRDRLESLSAAIIELSARSAAGDGVQGHGECEFYDKFVGQSGPVQEAIGDVLAQIREAEEAKGEGRRRRRRRRERVDA